MCSLELGDLLHMQVPGSTVSNSLGESPGSLRLIRAPHDFKAHPSLKTTVSKSGPWAISIGIIRGLLDMNHLRPYHRQNESESAHWQDHHRIYMCINVWETLSWATWSSWGNILFFKFLKSELSNSHGPFLPLKSPQICKYHHLHLRTTDVTWNPMSRGITESYSWSRGLGHKVMVDSRKFIPSPHMQFHLH